MLQIFLRRELCDRYVYPAFPFGAPDKRIRSRGPRQRDRLRWHPPHKASAWFLKTMDEESLEDVRTSLDWGAQVLS